MKSYHKYLLASQEDERWGMQVVTAGYGKIEKETLYPAKGSHPREYLFNWNKGRILNGFYIVYIARGRGIFESENTDTTIINEGTCFMLFPGIWHRYQPDPKQGWEEYWIGLKGSIIDDWMRKDILTRDSIFFDIGFNNNLIGLFTKLLGYIRGNPPELQPIITGISTEILGLILSTQKFKQVVTPEEKIEWACFFIKENLEQPIYYADVAREVNMSYSLFRKNFKKVRGISPGQYHLRIRIEKAKELIPATLLSVEEIAFTLGFESVPYFSRIFKKKTGYSPSVFRKMFFSG